MSNEDDCESAYRAAGAAIAERIARHAELIGAADLTSRAYKTGYLDACERTEWIARDEVRGE